MREQVAGEREKATEKSGIGRASGWFSHWHSRLKHTEHVYMVLLALIIGLLAGLCAVGFREFIGLTQTLLWQTHRPSLAFFHGLPAWWLLAIPAAGGLVVGLIIRVFAPEAKGHGVPEVMEAVALKGGRIRARIVAAKMAASGICIASGGSVGREGPIVQIGSSLGSAIGQWLGLGERRLRTLVGCGAAAGIAATFNAPIAGALFAVEVILGDFAVGQFSPMVISSVAATVVGRHFLGDTPAFEIPSYSLIHPGELFVYAVLGLIAGLAALAFIRALYATEDLFDMIRLPGPVKTAFGGLIIGFIALEFPQIMGVGYEAIDGALRGEIAISIMLVLVLMKILAVSVTIGSGGSGGIFAPSLFIGAMLGGGIGTLANLAWPGSIASPGAYALVGMGAVLASATHAPITAILIIFELTSDYEIILPLMISCILATLVATQLQRSSIYTLKLLRRGIDLWGGQSIDVLEHLTAQHVMRPNFASVSPDDPLMPVITRFMENPGTTLFVVDHDDTLKGVVTINEIRPILADLDALQPILIASDLMRTKEFPIFHPDDPLGEVMQRFGNYRFDAPVIEDGRMCYAIHPEDVIRRYNAELLRRDMASGMSSSLSDRDRLHTIPGVEGMSMAEVPVPASFAGRTIEELAIRRRHNVTILLVKRRNEASQEVVNKLPTAHFVFEEGDVLLVMGEDRHLLDFERGG